MANNLQLQAILDLVDRATAPLRRIMGGSQQAADALKTARSALRQLQQQQGDINSFKQLTRGLADTQQELGQARQKLQQMQAAIAATSNPTQKMIRDLQRQQLAVNRLTQAETDHTQQLQQVRQRLQQAGIDVNNLGQHEQRLAADMARANQAIREQQERLRRLNEINRQYQQTLHRGRDLRSTGANMVAGGAVASLPLVKMIKDYASFEDAMLGVAKQVEGARDENGKLTATYYQMAESIKKLSTEIPLATNEIAAIVEAGARMGIKGKEDLLTFTKTTATMASAFDLPVDQVGEDMAKIADLYKVPIKNISQLGDVINYLDDNTLSKGSDIIDVMQRIAGVAASVGMNYKEAAALGSSFLSMGASAEIAATASNAMIRELSIASMQPKRFVEGLDALGLKAADIQKNMAKDATGTIQKVLVAINKLPKDKQLTVATQLFGKEYGDDASKLANNLDLYKEQLALAKNSQATGSMDREAQARLENLSAQWQILKNQLFNQSSELGELLRKDVVDIGKVVGNTLKSITLWVKANPELASTLLKALAAIAALSIVLGTLAITLGSILVPFAALKFIWAYLGIQLPMLARGLVLLKMGFQMIAYWTMMAARALLTNPIVWAITLIATAVYLIYKNWTPIIAFFTSIGQSISQSVSNLWRDIKYGYDIGVSYLSTKTNSLLTFFKELPSKFMTIGSDIIGGLWQGIASRYENFKKYFGDIANNISQTVKDKLGIKSPSRVFAEIGVHTMTGLNKGLVQQQNQPLNTIIGLTKRLKQSATGLMLGGAITTATATPIDNRPPLSPHPSMASSGQSVFNITINASPGMDEKKLATLVRQQIEQHERSKQSRQRSALTDID